MLAGLFVLAGMAAGVGLVIGVTPRGLAPTPVAERGPTDGRAAAAPPRPMDADPVLTDLARARAAHAAEAERLRRALLADIDAVIREAGHAGQPIDWMPKDRKGFAENGVTPLIPPLQPATRNYQAGVRAADAALDAAYVRAAAALERNGRRPQAEAVRADLSARRSAPR
jgi:hypothetical protein